MIRPSSTDVRRIAQEEARSSRITFDEILAGRRAKHVAARHRAWRRIIEETGCSQSGLSSVWGCNPSSISTAVKPPLEATPAPRYDAGTRARLAWCHGPERAAEIVAGRDRATNEDIARWEGLGHPLRVAG